MLNVLKVSLPQGDAYVYVESPVAQAFINLLEVLDARRPISDESLGSVECYNDEWSRVSTTYAPHSVIAGIFQFLPAEEQDPYQMVGVGY